VRILPRQTIHQFGVFTTEQAFAAGWSQSALTRAIRSGTLIRLRRGAYASANDRAEDWLPSEDADDHAQARFRLGQRATAAALCLPSAAVSHASAVALHGLPVLDLPTRPCLTLPPHTRTLEADIHLHRQVLPPRLLDRHLDIATTCVSRSCLDLARESGSAAGLVSADAALHRGHCTVTELAAVARSLKGIPGSRAARRVAELADGRSESALETVSRLSMIEHLPAHHQPELQANIFSDGDRFIGRADFYWEALGVVGEADGRTKYADDALWREKMREDALTDLGLVVVRWGWSEARRPADLTSRLRRAFAKAELLRSAGVRPRATVRFASRPAA
jgi:hypothetical protein